MSEIIDSAYKFGCGRYRQEKGLISKAGEEIKRFGKKAFIIGGETALSITEEKLCKSLEENGVEFFMQCYTGQCSHDGADIMCEKLKEEGCDMAVGAGGGKIMDFAQLIAAKAHIPVINIPTSSATCAAYTTLSVLYDDSGKTVGNFYQELELNAVLVDTQIMAEQPKRLLFSGWLDALAKFIEMKNGKPEIDTSALNMDVYTASVLAKHTYDNLIDLLPKATEAIEKGEATDELDKFIYLAIPVTGIISGISKGFGQSALAHELYYCVRTLFTKEALSALHGEIVGIGLLAQTIYNGCDDVLPVLEKEMKAYGAPTRLSQIGIENTGKNFNSIYELTLKSPFVTHDNEHLEKFSRALHYIM